ncbi:hypothetical protein STTU_1682 [Streptomyces sp. Tu6071]|nr:hypothetical protein STTU_1682 [Streptomyces sp. Tu6071]
MTTPRPPARRGGHDEVPPRAVPLPPTPHPRRDVASRPRLRTQRGICDVACDLHLYRDVAPPL